MEIQTQQEPMREKWYKSENTALDRIERARRLTRDNFRYVGEAEETETKAPVDSYLFMGGIVFVPHTRYTVYHPSGLEGVGKQEPKLGIMHAEESGIEKIAAALSLS